MDLWLMAFHSAAACTWSLLKMKPACAAAHQAHMCNVMRYVEARGLEEYRLLSHHRESDPSYSTSLK